MFIYAEFEIINLFFKERRSKYKPAIALNTLHVLQFSCLYRDFSLVVEIWLKVMEIHWSKCVGTLEITNVSFAVFRLAEFTSETLKKPKTSELSRTPLSDRFGKLQDAENAWMKKVGFCFSEQTLSFCCLVQ